MLRRDKAIKFMRQARFVAKEFSKDPSTKVGAAALDANDYSVLSQGYNGMPRGVDEHRPERHERPLKYKFYEHAERNMIYNCARRVLKESYAITTTHPNISCVRALISVGTRLVCLPDVTDHNEDWNIALELFKETNVRVVYFSELTDDSKLTRKLKQYVEYAKEIPQLLAKDPEASVTLFLAPEEFTLLSQGYSGFPRGADDSKLERYHGEHRMVWVETSVRNAIYNVARQFLKGSAGLVTATTCIECARAMISVGMQEVIYVEPSPDLVSRWGTSFKDALTMFDEMGVQTTMLSEDEVRDK